MAPTKAKKGNSLLHLLSSIWGLIKTVVLLALLAVGIVEIFTPSLNYTTSAPKPFRSATPAGWIEAGEAQPVRSYRTTLLTNDYRNVQVDYYTPDNINSGSIPLTIIVAGFMAPEWLMQQVNPRGFNAVVIYRSPRINRIIGNAFPTALQARNARSFQDYWNIFATNPLNYVYSIHAGLHEAPGDIADIARWAVSNINADVNRINIIGLGSGALIAAAAADGLQSSGMPARTLTLVNPPANMASAIEDNLLEWPKWLRRPLSKALSYVYFRLDLKRHLPRINTASKLLVIPQNAFEIASYAAEPTVGLAGDKTTVERFDLQYKGFYESQNTSGIHDIVGRWLVDKGGIQSY